MSLSAYQTPTWVESGGEEADRDGFWALVAGTLDGDLDLPARLLWASPSFP